MKSFAIVVASTTMVASVQFPAVIGCERAKERTKEKRLGSERAGAKMNLCFNL